MNKEARERIREYVRDKDLTPLKFPKKVKIDDLEKLTLWELIDTILVNTHYHGSINSITNELETTPGRRRSSLDIWRHVIYYRPDVDIIDIIKEIGNSYGKIGSCIYCLDVKRRVFRSWKIFKTIGYNSEPDEYGLSFGEWKDI